MFLETVLIANIEYFEPIREIVTCTICTGLIVNPIQCSKCENYYCSSCLDEWSKTKNICPMRCTSPMFHEGGRIIKNILEKIVMFCPFGCAKKLIYEEVLMHEDKCKSDGNAYKLINEKLNYDLEQLKHKYENIDMAYKNLKLKKQMEDLHNQHLIYNNTTRIECLEKDLSVLKEENEKMKGIIDHYTINNTGNTNNKFGTFNNPLFTNNDNIGYNYPFPNEILIIIKDCNHERLPFVPLCGTCKKAYPCFACHDLSENHHCPKDIQNALCEKCYVYNTLTGNFMKCKNTLCTNILNNNQLI